MSLFGIKTATDRYGVIIDVGSGSVLTAIVHSNSKEKHPTIVWSHREHAPLRNIDSIEQSAKAVITALVNASMQLDTVGRKILFEYDPSAKPTAVQCGISAPWAYTVTKTINYTPEQSFIITDTLLEDLTETIQQKIESDIKENEALLDLGLEVVTRTTMDILSNGYHVKHPEGNYAETLNISSTSVVTQNYLIESLNEMYDKLFPEVIYSKISFILILYSVTRELFIQTYDFCLLDITYEATEIGIVRDGILTYCTHTPFGLFSLAREISEATNTPLHEAFGYLHTDTPRQFMENLPASKQKEVEAIFEAYIERVAKLLHETGDALSIPKRISLHSDLGSEALFLDLVKKAVKRTVKTEPIITPISKEIISKTYNPKDKNIPTDTALLASAHFFHTGDDDQRFEYL